MILEDSFKRSWKPPDRRPPWQWMEEHLIVDITSPFPGRWRSSTSPWVKEPLEVFPDNRVSHISIMCSAQSSKTQTVMGMAAWAIAEDPGPGMWVMAASDEAKTFSKTRLMPTFEKCPPVAALFPEDRHHKMTLEINFQSMPLVLTGANSKSKLQSKPIRWLFLDEVRNYPYGALEMVMKRVTAWWNARIVMISTAAFKDDPVHRAFLEGDQRYYHVLCPACGNRAPLKFRDGERYLLRYTTDEKTKPHDKWNFEELAKTIRYHCPKCDHGLEDRQDIRKALALSGVYVPHNPMASESKKSFTWNALLPPWIKWRTLVEEWIQANEAKKKGDIEPLRTFVNERLGEPFDEQEHQIVEYDRPESTYSIEEIDQAFGDFRFMTVDVQSKEFWVVIRGWMKSAESKLMFAGNPLTWGEVRELQEQFKIENRHVLVDSGYDTSRVYAKCCQFDWTALKGEDKPHFIHHLKNGKAVRRLYSPLQRGDPGIGTVTQGKRYASLILWSNPWAYDILERLRSGQGAPWELPKNVPDFYLRQMSAMVKKERIDPRSQRIKYEWVTISRNNHSWDCEAMQVAAASMARIISTSEEETESQNVNETH